VRHNSLNTAVPDHLNEKEKKVGYRGRPSLGSRRSRWKNFPYKKHLCENSIDKGNAVCESKEGKRSGITFT